MDRIRFRLPRFSQRQMPESAPKPAPSVPANAPADPAELVLAEVWALRYALLNLFHAAFQSASEGRQLSPDSVLTIRDQADARKLQQARKLLDDFFAREGKEGTRMP